MADGRALIFTKLHTATPLQLPPTLLSKKWIEGSLKAVSSELEQRIVERTCESEHANQRLTDFTCIASDWP